jgi:peptide-methionine (S)-S-oxide reductase
LKTEIATFAAGCFWGVENDFRHVKGVIATAVGYTGGHKENATYKEVCAGYTGHAEAVQVEFDPAQVSYEQLLDVFWQIHDPTQKNRQGPDVGEQYRSAIFVRNAEQRKAAEESLKRAQTKYERPIATEITDTGPFWMAEEYHQQYCEKNGITGCRIK